MRLYQWVLTAAALTMSLPLAFLLHSQITREQTTGIVDRRNRIADCNAVIRECGSV